MNDEHAQTPTGSTIGWYGKIPGNGDFVQRGLPATLVNQWAHWFQSGLAARQVASAHRTRYSLSGAPLWHFILPATLGTPQVQMGCLMPSHDRVGRHYPLFAMWQIAPQHWHHGLLVQAPALCGELAQVLRPGVRHGHSVERIDQALQALGQLLPSECEQDGTPQDADEWLEAFDPQRYASIWWRCSASGAPFDAWVHSGNLTVQLFHHLFAPADGMTDARPEHYGQMFD
ncbi:type VI secretion system-associated protein TagF [Enterobacteriaceae bacterium 4M9]|nr:type VI secretion system-associated protein TagF [Enterobacteriaceae bacterium 4M9]